METSWLIKHIAQISCPCFLNDRTKVFFKILSFADFIKFWKAILFSTRNLSSVFYFRITITAIILNITYFNNSLYGQNFKKEPSFSAGVSYFGEFVTHGGINLFSKTTFLQTKRHALSFEINTSYYKHKQFNKNINIFPQIEYSFRFKKSALLLGVGYGLIFSAPDGKVYSKTADGSFELVKNKWLLYKMYGLSLTYERRYQISEKRDIFPYLSICAYYQTPFNEHKLFHFAIELGIKTNLK